jgi:hypothetical protein
LRCRYRSQPLVLGLLAGLTTFWFVFEPLVVEENLLARSPNEVFVAVDAPDGAVLILAFLGSFHYLCGFHVCHDLLPSGPLPKNHHAGGRLKIA